MNGMEHISIFEMDLEWNEMGETICTGRKLGNYYLVFAHTFCEMSWICSEGESGNWRVEQIPIFMKAQAQGNQFNIQLNFSCRLIIQHKASKTNQPRDQSYCVHFKQPYIQHPYT